MQYFRSIMSIALCCALLCVAPAYARSSPRLVSIDVHGVDIYTVLAMLATESGANIVADNTSVKHDVVTISLTNVSFETALRTIELSDGLDDVRQNGIIFVASSDALSRRVSGPRDGIQTKLLAVNNADVSTIATALASALPTGTIIIPDARTHGVLVTGDVSTISRAQQLIGILDEQVNFSGRNAAVHTTTIPLQFISDTDALTAVKSAVTLPGDASILASPNQNALVVTGSHDLITSVQGLLLNLDAPGQQVIYEVRVVDLEPVNNSSNIGASFGGISLSGQPVVGATSTFFQGTSLAINATINAMITTGHGETLADPRLAVLNNHEGSLLIGETRPISYVNAQTGALQLQMVDIGVKLRLTPTIGTDGYVTTDLHPEFSALLGVNAQGIPIISNRKVDTVARVRDGESIVLAGLLQDISTTSVQKVPWLGDLPIFGALFRDTTTTHTHDEIVFIITPHIVTDKDIFERPTPPLPIDGHP